MLAVNTVGGGATGQVEKDLDPGAASLAETGCGGWVA